MVTGAGPAPAKGGLVVFFPAGVYRRAARLAGRLPRYAQLSRRFAGIRWTFIVGPQHSGTTLLFSMLSSHPDVHAIPRESFAFRDLGGPEWFQIHWGRFQLLHELAHSLPETSRLPEVVLEKTPSHLSEIPAMTRAFPGARFVVIVRDPLDTIFSVHRRGVPLADAIESWSVAASQAVAIRPRDDVELVHLEHLIASPQAELEAVQRHLGLPVADLARWHETLPPVDATSDEPDPRDHAERRRWQVRQPLMSDRSGLWREHLSPAEIGRVVDGVRPVARDLGYLLPDAPSSSRR